jgi:hypothetical protein
VTADPLLGQWTSVRNLLATPMPAPRAEPAHSEPEAPAGPPTTHQAAPAPRAFADRARAAGHWTRDTGLGITGFVLVLIVALAGWTASFIGLHAFGMDHMGLDQDTAWLVPITFDGAAAGLSLVVFRASINGRGATTWRLLIVTFTALSAWINWAHISDPTGRWIASYMPPAAVILFEGLMSEARAAASRRLGTERPRLHPLRWAIDRAGTWAIYRAYVLGIELPEHLQATVGESARESTGETPPESESARVPLSPPAARESAGESAGESGSETPPESSSESESTPTRKPRESNSRRRRTGKRESGKVAALGGIDREIEQLVALMRKGCDAEAASLKDAKRITRKADATAARRLAVARAQYRRETATKTAETGS